MIFKTGLFTSGGPRARTKALSRAIRQTRRASRVLIVTLAIAAIAAVYFGASTTVGASTKATLPTFGVVTAIQHPYYNKTKAAMAPTCRAIGCKYIFVQPPKCDAQTESQIIQDVVARGIQGLAIAACDAKGIEPTVKRAAATGIPVVTFDADCCHSTRKIAISNSDAQIGENHAKIINKLLPKGGKIIVTITSLTFENVRARYAPLKKFLRKNIKVEVFSGEDTPEKAASIVRDALTKIPDAKLILDQAGYGGVVAQTLKKDGRKPGEILFVTINDFPDILKFVRQGYITATVALNSGLQGELALRSLKLLLDGKKPSKTFVGTPSAIITRGNLTTYRKQVARDNAVFTKKFLALWH
jgi:ribose transport system substrate-binding protein